MKDKDLPQDTGRICAVVVTYNRKELLEECLTALLNQTKPLDEIIVMDNASTDGTEELVKAIFSGVTYVKLAENIGGSGGFHGGIKLAFEKGHDWIWVMDDDAITMADALEKLTSCPMILHDNVYALASAVLNRDGSINLLTRRLFDSKRLREKPVPAGQYKSDYFQMDTASFVGFLISRKAIEEVGLPIKDFFIYFDDTEYSLRMREKGIMFTVPGSQVIHGEIGGEYDKSDPLRPPIDWKRYYAIRNRIFMYKKHGKPGLAFYYNLLARINEDRRETLYSRPYNLWSVKILLCGIFDGLRGKLGKNGDFTPD